jgi:hypothetical protein
MAFSFRKSKKIGLFRISLSKGGIGISTGIKGLRVGANSKGTYTTVSIPKTGIYSTKYAKKAKIETTATTQPTAPSVIASIANTPVPVNMRRVVRGVLWGVLCIILVPVVFVLSPVLLTIAPFVLIFWLWRKRKKSGNQSGIR